MTHTRHIGRWAAGGVLALVVTGSGIASATTEPPADTDMATDDTAMVDTTEPMAGGGPSDCPTIGEAEVETTEAADETDMADATEAPDGTDMADATEAADETDMADATAAADGTEPADTDAAVSGPFVQVAESEFGPVLVDAQCLTLYGFTQDAEGEPTCVDDCAANWPPLFVDDDAVPPLADELAELEPGLFSVVEHADGPQLRAGDWPLYLFAGDEAPGDTNGHGVGGVWFMVDVTGVLIEEEAPEETEAMATTTAPADEEADDSAVETTTG